SAPGIEPSGHGNSAPSGPTTSTRPSRSLSSQPSICGGAYSMVSIWQAAESSPIVHQMLPLGVANSARSTASAGTVTTCAEVGSSVTVADGSVVAAVDDGSSPARSSGPSGAVTSRTT